MGMEQQECQEASQRENAWDAVVPSESGMAAIGYCLADESGVMRPAHGWTPNRRTRFRMCARTPAQRQVTLLLGFFFFGFLLHANVVQTEPYP